MSALPQLAIVPATDAAWIDAAEAMRRTGWSAFWLREQVKRGKVLSRESDQRAANGRPVREYFAGSLPAAAQPAPAQTQLALVRPQILGPLFADLPALSSIPVMLPDPDDQKQAAARYAILEPILDFDGDPARYATLRLTDGRAITSRERMIEYAAELQRQAGHDVSPRTIKRWLARFRADAFPALADRIRADKGQSRWFARHHDAAVLAAYLYLGDIDRLGLRHDERQHRGQSVAFVHEQICQAAERLGIVGELPSRETVRAFLSQQISPAMKALAREGCRQYRERMSPFLRRMYTDIYANQVWVGDQMIHDVEVANDLFTDAPLGTPVRIRLDAMIDYRSRKIVGATWGWFGSSRTIAATLRRAIQQFGPPEMIYVDNGKDYKKVAKGATHGFCVEPWRPEDMATVEATGFLARAAIGITHCIPRHPQSKHVERCFRTVHLFDGIHSTYTSGSPWTRPEQTGEAMMQHRRLFKAGRVAESRHPLASQLIMGCLSWIEEYNNTPHSGEGMDGRSPNEVFAAELNPNQRPAPDAATLTLLMAEYERRHVHECAVTLNKRRYTPAPADRMAWAAMHEQNEREILIAYDPADPECAAALDLDGRFLAWIEAEQLLRFAPNDPATQRQIGESMEIRRGLEQATKGSLRAIAAAARANGAQSAEDMHYGRLQLPATAGPVVTQHAPRLRPDKQAAAPPSASAIAQRFLEALKK